VSTQTLTGTPTLPRVNLLPPEIAEARRFRRVRVGLGAAVAVSVLGVGALYMHAHSGVGAAQQQLTQAQDENTSLTRQLAQYQNVTALKDQVEVAETNLQQAMGPQVLWSHYMSDLSLVLPGNVWLTEVQVALGNDGSASSPGGIAGALPSADAIGAISLKGSALSHDDVAALLTALAKEKGFSDPYLTQSAESVVQNTTKRIDDFQGSVDLSTKALSNRYSTPSAGD
jgi:Tfp pilus assembly protein PilN